MKTALSCVFLFLVVVFQVQAYEPPKGITWDMTIHDIDSIIGIKFKLKESKSEFILDYQAIDRYYEIVGPLEEKIREKIKIRIPDFDNAKIINLHVQCNKETGKIVRFNIDFNPNYYEAPPYFRRALAVKYGTPDKEIDLGAYWEDNDGSWVLFIAKPERGRDYSLEYMRIVYGSSSYNRLVEKEREAEMQRRAEEQRKKEAEQKKSIMDSDF